MSANAPPRFGRTTEDLKKNENDLKLLVKQLDEARSLQKKLTKEPNAERDQLRILKEKIVEELSRNSKKMEEVEALVTSVGEVLQVLDKRKAALKMLTEDNTAGITLRNVEEQLKNLKTKETDGIS